jgi:hypothetical protein
MTMPYVVGIRVGSKPDQIAIEAEDALIAALGSRRRIPKPSSPTCASGMPAATNAIRTPAKPPSRQGSGRARAGMIASLTGELS